MDPGELAFELDISYQAVKKVLDGKSAAFSAPNHAKAAIALNVSSDWLALGTGAMEREPGETREVWPFSASLDDYRRISDGKKRELDARVTGFIEGALPPSQSSKSA